MGTSTKRPVAVEGGGSPFRASARSTASTRAASATRRGSPSSCRPSNRRA
jgi:hypothetical protein